MGRAYLSISLFPLIILALTKLFSVEPSFQIISDTLFYLGLALFGTVALSVCRKLSTTIATLLGLQVLMITLIFVEFVSVFYTTETGSLLSLEALTFAYGQAEGMRAVIAPELTASRLLLSGVALSVMLAGPLLLLRWKDTRIAKEKKPRLLLLGATLLLGLSTLFGPENNQIVQLSASMIQRAIGAEEGGLRNYPLGWNNLSSTYLVPEDPEAKTKNLVIIILESTRADALRHSPFMKNVLLPESTYFSNAYTIVPHTSKALHSIFCGTEPYLVSFVLEAAATSLVGKCIPDLLAEMNYQTAYFQSAWEHFEQRRKQTQNMGFGYFKAANEMDQDAFAKLNYFGWEDDIMLGPTESWLRGIGDEPFFAAFLTVTAHHPYNTPEIKKHVAGQKRGVRNKKFATKKMRYASAIRYQDGFVERLLDLFKASGRYQDTVFVMLGDHGEGFLEHGRKMHNSILEDEGAKIPWLIFDPSNPVEKVVRAPVNLLDTLPTVLAAIGFRISGGSYPGRDVRSLTESRDLLMSCFYANRCFAVISGGKKYISRPNGWDSVYDLEADPNETQNLIEKYPEFVAIWRDKLQVWRNSVNAKWEPQRIATDVYGSMEPFASMGEQDFSGMNFDGRKLNGVRLDNSTFDDTQFQETDLHRSRMRRSRFISSNFVRSNLSSSDFLESHFTDSNFDGAELSNIIMTRTTHEGTSFRGVKSFLAKFDDTQMVGVDFSRAKLVYANFSGADLKHTSFRDADLRGANFSRAKCDGCDFAGAKVDDKTVLPKTLPQRSGDEAQ